jgi:hypothetical protein
VSDETQDGPPTLADRLAQAQAKAKALQQELAAAEREVTRISFQISTGRSV